jgi:hypothetical protein
MQRCATCYLVTRPGYRRCFKCEEHHWLAAGELADAVMPLGYAISGGQLATDLWRYKSGVDAAQAAARLRGRLTGFLREHRGCLWRAAGMPGGPQRWAVVPSGRGRTGDHPLTALVAPYLRGAPVRLGVRAGRFARGRDLDPGWLIARGQLRGADVLLVEDTWVTGGSVQSAAIALKRAGARRVAVLVLGRHIAAGTGPVPDLPECVAHVATGHTGNSAA